MAFELIFGKSTQPGSWPVAEQLLSIDSPTAIEKLLKNIRDDAYSKVVSQSDHQRFLALESERDAAFARKDLDTSFKKCMEIAVLSKTFTKDNIIKAENSFVQTGQLVNTVGIDFVLVYLFHSYYGYVSKRFTPLEETVFLKTALLASMIPHMIDLTLSARIGEFLSISDVTCALDRMSYVASFDVTLSVIQRMHQKVNTKLLNEFIDKIGTNSTLVKLLESPLDFPSMQLFERLFTISFASVLSSICDLDQTGKVTANLRRKKWFAKFVSNLALTAESSDNLKFWMVIGEGGRYCALLKFFLYPSPPTNQVPCESIDSVHWLSNISAAGVLLCTPTMEPEMSLVSFAFTIRLHKMDLIEELKNTKGLAKSLDLIHFLSAVNFAEWKKVMLSAETESTVPVTRTTYTLLDMCESFSDILERMMTKLSYQPLPKLCQHLSSFVQVVSQALFYAENINELSNSIDECEDGSIWGGHHMMKLFEFCDLIMSTATSPKDIAQMCSTTRVRGICNLAAARFLGCPYFLVGPSPMIDFVTSLLARLCSASPPVFLKELMSRRVNAPFWSHIFSKRISQLEFGYQLVATAVRHADAKQRREWATEYRGALRAIGAMYFTTFNKGGNSHKDELNLLLAINGIFRPSAIVSFRSILDAVDSNETKSRLALKQMLSKTLSTGSQNFLKVAKAQNPYQLEKVRTVGSLVAGIFVASLLNELKGNTVFDSVILKEKAGRKALIADMKRQLLLF